MNALSNRLSLLTALAFIFAHVQSQSIAEETHSWKPGKVPLMTRWGKEVTPDNAWDEYPRPQMVRQSWSNLNGMWDLAIVAKGTLRPKEFPLQILVPFCVESSLSGVTRTVLPADELWYRRKFTLSPESKNQRTLLHFGAVDWECTLYINGREVGSHRGGFVPFSFDITNFLSADTEQEIALRVWDPTDEGSQPRGKQQLQPGGIWYTPVSGIWQTVWLETVPESYLSSVQPETDIDQSKITLNCSVVDAAPGDKVRATLSFNGDEICSAEDEAGKALILPVKNPQLWTPDSPSLYAISVRLIRGSTTLDAVGSYTAMRKVSMGIDEKGFPRIMLNNKPLFQYGPLDQGWWPDGLLTPPSDEAMRYDLEVLKQLGMNMLRKHIKVEPARLYFHCDQLGLLVWQDMPSSMQKGRNHFVQPGQATEAEYRDDEKRQFRAELTAMLDHLRFFPSIVVWVPFNEGWGQHDTNEILAWVKKYDPSRLVDGPSGWTDRDFGDMKDMHNYPGPGMFPVMKDRISVLGEFGGLGYPITGHLWKENDNWGYRTYRSQEELDSNYEQLMLRLHPLIGEGLAAAIYTQTTDVEIEVNGLMTYDREVMKVKPERFAKIHQRLWGPAPVIKTLIPDARQAEGIWRYTTKDPGTGWEKKTFNDSNWTSGKGGFGTPDTPATIVRSRWDNADIWLRREVSFDKLPEGELWISIHHDEDAEIFINGVLAATTKGYTTGYTTIPVSQEGRAALVQGENIVALHCHQTGGGQYIDIGFVELTIPETSKSK